MVDIPSDDKGGNQVFESKTVGKKGKEEEGFSSTRKDDLTQIVYGMAIPAFAIDDRHVVTHWNPACEKLTRIKGREIVGTVNAWRAFYTEQRPVLADLIVDQAGEHRIGSHYGGRYARSELVEGAYEAYDFFPDLGEGGKWLFFTATPLRSPSGETMGAIETFQDITRQKQAERELASREAFLNILIDSIPIPVFYKDIRGAYLGVNKAFEAFIGKTKKEVLHRSVFDISELDLAHLYHAMDTELFENGGDQQYESMVRDADGVLRDVIFSKAVFTDSRGHAGGLIGAIFDITDRKRMENELQESQRQLATLMSNLPGMAYRRRNDPHWTMEFVSDGCHTLTGHEPDALIGNASISYTDLIHPQDRQMVIDTVGVPLKSDRKFQLTYRIVTSAGEEKWVMEQGQGIPYPAGDIEFMEGFVTDITSRKAMEDQLRQAHKMEAIGTLSGGIAHDFNNILSSIFGFTELAKMKRAKGEDIDRDLDEILNAGHRARDLVKQILTFSRQTDLDKKPVLMGPLIKETLKLLRASLPATIEIHSQVEAIERPVLADPSQIHQIVMNLCTNAAHAMGNKAGVLDIRLQETEIGDERLPHDELGKGPYMLLSVSDTGHGIPEALQDRIFDPFFTTKKREEGTGLGLAAVHGIVKEMGGDITVRSEPGKGSTFNILIPACEDGADTKIFPDDRRMCRGRGTILFVDDEEGIVKSGRGILEKLGYAVVATTSSPEALEIFRSRSQDFALVLTDMTMPEMSGLELSRKILKIRPDIPILLCTGFGVGLTKDLIRGIGIREMVMKPMIASELAEAVASALDLTS